MKTLKSIIVLIISFFISALILYPCLILTLLSNDKIDYHHRFHLWWWDNVLDKNV